MGFFSDRCEALVDKVTGERLTGERLQAAQAIKGWPRCGNRVPKKATYCSKCKAAAPGGWFRCASCGKWIGNDSKCCPHCGGTLHPDTRMDMAGGTWEKDGAVFAQRFEVGDVARLLKQENLQVQEGTLALLLDGGKYMKHLEAGRHNPASLARTINWFGNPPPRSLIMVDAGDVRLPIEIDGLRTAEKIPVDFAGDLVLRFDPKRADQFIANFLKEKRELSYVALASLLAGEIKYVVEGFCVKTNMADLAFDPERRKRLTDDLQRGLKTACERLGIEMVYVATADFAGDEYEKLVKAEGDLVLKRREIEFSQATRELLTRDRMHEFKTELDLKAYLAGLAHEFGISEHKRKREEEVLLRGWKKQDELEDLQHRIDLENRELEHAFNIERQKRADALEVARMTAEIRMIETDTQMDAATKALRLKELKYEIKAKKKAADAARRKGMSLPELLLDAEDPEARRALLAWYQQEAAKGMTPEQLLAMTAQTNPAAAEALKALAQGKTEADRRLLEDMKVIYKETREHDERMAETLIQPAIEAAKRKGDGGNIINRV